MKAKQILAILGIIILVLLYVSTLVFAISGSDNWFNMLMASIIATILIPMILHWWIRMHERKKNSDEQIL